MHALTGRLGRTPLENEVAAEMHMSLDEYQHLLTDLQGLEIGSLDVAHWKILLRTSWPMCPTLPKKGRCSSV